MGEELCITYVKMLEMGYEERQRELMPWLGRECGCVRCLSEKPKEEIETEEQENGGDDAIPKGVDAVLLT